MTIKNDFIRVGSHVLNVANINHVHFDMDIPPRGGQAVLYAYIDFGWETGDWDMILTGQEAELLEKYFTGVAREVTSES